MTDDYIRSSIMKTMSKFTDNSIIDKMVITASNMMVYLNHKFSSHRTHLIENIELDSFRVDITIFKRSSSIFVVTVHENKFMREHTPDTDETPKKYYKAVLTSIPDIVLKLMDLLHNFRYDKRSNSYESILGTVEVEFLKSLLPDGSLDYLKCSVCLDYYNNHTEIFTCSHTLCMPCQQNFVRNKLPCPLCRANFGYPEEDDDEEDIDYEDDSSTSSTDEASYVIEEDDNEVEEANVTNDTNMNDTDTNVTNVTDTNVKNEIVSSSQPIALVSEERIFRSSNIEEDDITSTNWT